MEIKMFLHIGKDISVNSKNVIGIFNIESIEKTNEYQQMLKELDGNVIDIAGERKKTLVLVIENDMKKGYITNILSTTLEKRTKADI